MGEVELTHLVGGGILAILVLDRATNLVRVALGKKNDETQPMCQTLLHVESLAKATSAGFAAQAEDNKAIREHLHTIATTLGSVVTGIAIIKDRSHRDPP